MAGEKDSAPALPEGSLEEQFRTQADIVKNGQDDYDRDSARIVINAILDAHLEGRQNTV